MRIIRKSLRRVSKLIKQNAVLFCAFADYIALKKLYLLLLYNIIYNFII